MDRPTRKVLARRISNTLEANVCVEALNEAIARVGTPEIVNTYQGSHLLAVERALYRAAASPNRSFAAPGRMRAVRNHTQRDLATLRRRGSKTVSQIPRLPVKKIQPRFGAHD